MRLAHVPTGPEAIPAIKKDHLYEALHSIHMALLNPRHDQFVHQHLDQIHASGRRSKVLDVGTGTGSWVIALARLQPYSDVVGIDIAWDQFEGTRLPHGNADFHTVDVTLPLPWGDETFDLIHVKSMLMEIPSYADMVRALTRLLKPDGLLVLVEAELSFVSVNGAPAPGVAKWSAGVRRAIAETASSTSSPSLQPPDASKLDAVIAATGSYAPQFYFQEVGCPIGGYMTASATLHRAGTVLGAVVDAQMGSVLEARRFDGDSKREELRRLRDGCVRELSSDEGRYVQRLFAVYARKA